MGRRASPVSGRPGGASPETPGRPPGPAHSPCVHSFESKLGISFQNIIRRGKGQIAVTQKRTLIALSGLFSVSLLIVLNAVYWQSGRHPAPIGAVKVHKPPAPGAAPARDTGTARRPSGQAAGPFAALPRTAQTALIRRIQEELGKAGFYNGRIDGLYGPQTRAAIRGYQQSAGIAASGVPSAELPGQIRFSRLLNAGQSTGSTKPKIDKSVVLVQTGLAELGYSPGPVDGIMGRETRAAIRRFEKERGMKVSGAVSARLIHELRKVTGISALSTQ